MSTDALQLKAAYEACLTEALRQGPLMIGRWCDIVCDELKQRFTSSLQNVEKHHLQAAAVILHRHEAEITKTFMSALTSALERGAQRSARSTGKDALTSGGATSFDELTLMGDHEVQNKVNSTRLQQTVALVCEPGLAAFSARLSTAQGFAQVKIEDNPLHPRVFSKALLQALQNVPADSVILSLWFTHGGELMGKLLQALYLELNQLLIDRGVAPAAYRVVTMRQSNSPGKSSTLGSLSGSDGNDFAASGFAASSFAPQDSGAGDLPTIDFSDYDAARQGGSRDAPSRVQQTVNRLRRLFTSDDSDGTDDSTLGHSALTAEIEPIVHHDFGHTRPEALTALDDLNLNATDAGASTDKTIIAAPLAVIQLRKQLKAGAKSLGQSLALDVVTLMIEKITGDARLLLSVREVVATFEPTYLKLAVKDPRFFRDQSHPARRLLETITTKSLAYSSVTAPGFTEFMQDLLRTAAVLTKKQAPDAQYFADLLASFDKKTKQRSAQARGNHSFTEEALVEAEQSMLLAKKIATEIAARPDFAADNSIIAAFLLGVWSQVMAKERLTVNADTTGMHKAIFSLTLGELLWSLNSEKTALNRKRLAKLIPSILERVQGGLLSIESPLADSKAFFNEMLAIHRSALDSGNKSATAGAKKEKSAGDNKRKNDIDSLFGTRHNATGARSRSAPDTEQHFKSSQSMSTRSQAGFQGTQPFFDTDAVEGPAKNKDAVVLGDAELHLGAWIELSENDHWVRAQLTWMSKYKTLFIFTSADGRTHSLAGPLLEFLLLQGQVKVISQEGVLEGALESITRRAMRNAARAGEQAEQSSRH